MNDTIPFPSSAPLAPLDVLAAQLYQLRPLQTYSRTELQQRGISDELLERSFPLLSFSSPPYYYGASIICQALNQYMDIDHGFDGEVSVEDFASIAALGGVQLRKGIIEFRLRTLEEQNLIPIEQGRIRVRHFNTILWDVLQANFSQTQPYPEKIMVLPLSTEKLEKGHVSTTAKANKGPSEDYNTFIRIIAYRFARRLPQNITVDDLVSAGWVGLLEAQEKYDGIRDFKKYAAYRIKGSMLDYLRAEDPLGRDTRTLAKKIRKATDDLYQDKGEAVEDDLASKVGISVEQLRTVRQRVFSANRINIEDLSIEGRTPKEAYNFSKGDLENDLVNRFSHEWVRKALAQVTHAKSRECVTLYFFQDLNLCEIGKLFNVTESRACQLLGQGLKELRAILQNVEL